jgi:Arc/MetJ-type ribon-helix-helix transcriptional regulator
VKLSVSLSEKDVEILDQHVQLSGLRSRSAALHQAVRLLAQLHLEDEYAVAFADWEVSGERAAWEQTVGDGVADAAG